MKKLFIFLIGIVILGSVGWYYHAQIQHAIYFSPCDSPIAYKIGEIDEGFNLTYAELKNDISEAAAIWDQVEHKPLYVFDSDAKLTVNLIFDDRQSLTNQIDTLDSQLKNEKNTITPKMQEYKNLEQDFKTRLANLNSQIAYWNAKGGAPKR